MRKCIIESVIVFFVALCCTSLVAAPVAVKPGSGTAMMAGCKAVANMTPGHENDEATKAALARYGFTMGQCAGVIETAA
jgi:hypothetical protein